MRATLLITILLGALSATPSFAQGQDGTVAERDILILSQLLPGYYSNANQAYFDVRLKEPLENRHALLDWEVTATDTAQIDGLSFLVTVSGPKTEDEHYAKKGTAILNFSVDHALNVVRMKSLRLRESYSEGLADSEIKSLRNTSPCDLLWSQEAGQFRGRLAQPQRCKPSSSSATKFADIMLSEDALWVRYLDANSQLEYSSAPSTEPVRPTHFAMDRARSFSCYADIPGVGGGRDIPFERYQLSGLHDLGGEKWFTTKDGEEIGINLFRVMWTFNNYQGVFTRPSLVVYVKTKESANATEPNAKPTNREVGYAWTEPTAQRIGINLKWVLVNCFMVSNEDVVPYYKNNEPRL